MRPTEVHVVKGNGWTIYWLFLILVQLVLLNFTASAILHELKTHAVAVVDPAR